MTEAQFLEAIDVQVTMGQMMPAVFSRQCLDAIALYLDQRYLERSFERTKNPSLEVRRNPPLDR
jgi:hypothetical protein